MAIEAIGALTQTDTTIPRNAGIGQDDFQRAGGRRVAVEHRLQVLFDASEH